MVSQDINEEESLIVPEQEEEETECDEVVIAPEMAALNHLQIA